MEFLYCPIKSSEGQLKPEEDKQKTVHSDCLNQELM